MGGGVKYEYDLAGDQRRIMTMGGASQELEYDARGLITGIADNNRKQGHEMACSTQNGIMYRCAFQRRPSQGPHMLTA